MKRAASDSCPPSRHGRALWAFMLIAPTVLAQAPARAEVSPDMPTTFQSRDHQVIMSLHAIGEQIYECKPAADGANAWTFREPIASLMQDGKTVGRHYAGPNWDVADGGVSGKMVTSAPSGTPDSIAQLELRVVDRRGAGAISDAQWVLRLHTLGGMLTGPCAPAGAMRGVPYTADYLFLK